MNRYERYLSEYPEIAPEIPKRLTAREAVAQFPIYRDWILNRSWYSQCPATAYFVVGGEGNLTCMRGVGDE